MSKAKTERILCFRASLLDELCRFQGVSFDVARYFPKIVTPPACHYVVRRDAE